MSMLPTPTYRLTFEVFCTPHHKNYPRWSANLQVGALRSKLHKISVASIF